jgi:hypothetical protein
MSEPLDAGVVDMLTGSQTSALAAAFVIAHEHLPILQFVARICGATKALAPQNRLAGTLSPKLAGGRPRRSKGLHNGISKSSGHGHVDPRLAARDVADEKLLAAIAKTPGLSRAEMCNRISRSPNTVKSTLQRLRDAGHIERDDDGAWKLVEDRAGQAGAEVGQTAERQVSPRGRVARRPDEGKPRYAVVGPTFG